MLRETGHLTSIIGKYMSEVDGKLKRQIARKARNKSDGNFSETFYNTNDMTNVVFSLGHTKIGGVFNGFVEDNNGLLEVDGAIEFYLKDEFADPADIGEIRKRLGNEDAQDVDIVHPTRISEMIYENIHRPLDNYIRGRTGLPKTGPEKLGLITGTPYNISDKWLGTRQGNIFLDASRSDYA